MPIKVNQRLEIPDSELSWTYAPSGGPGGQHANKAHTRAEVVWNIAKSKALSDFQRERLLKRFGAIIRVSADDERSQLRNRDAAEHRLAEKVRLALHVPKKRRPTKPSRGAVRRRLKAKKHNSELKRSRQKPTKTDY